MDRRMLFITVVIGLASVSLIAQVRVSTQLAKQGFNPTNPEAVGHPVITGKNQNPSQLLGDFTVTNYSTKTVSAIAYGWRIAAPVKCVGHTLETKWGAVSTDITISPGAEAEIKAPEELAAEGSSKLLANSASEHKANVVLVTIGLLEVTYTDGTKWQDTEALNQRTFDAGEAELASDCKVPVKPTGPINTARCGGKPSIDQLLGKGDKPDAELVRTFAGETCRTLYCTPWMIWTGTCDLTQCDIFCCGVGCYEPCIGYCNSATWFWTRCLQYSVY